jgi:hypothetical protein
MNKSPNYLNYPARRIVAVISFALVCASLASNANAENRLKQQNALGEATSRLLANNPKLAPDATLRASAVGFLMELTARVEHLGDLEELMSVAEPVTQNLLKKKLEKLSRYDFGYGCAMTVNTMDAYASAAHDVDLASSLQAAKHLVADICATTEAR